MAARKVTQNKLETSFIGTTKKLDRIKTGCVFTFKYTAKNATDPTPVIIMTKPKWTAKNGKTYISGVNINSLGANTRIFLLKEFGRLPVGSVSFDDLKDATKSDPSCCIRTYNVRNIRALHKVEV